MNAVLCLKEHMHLDDFEIKRWERLDTGQQLVKSEQLVRHLPEGFLFEHIEVCSLGTETHPVAFFEWLPSRTPASAWCQGTFALIPGGAVTLGYDRSSPWKPTLAQQESWHSSREEYGFPDLPEYLDGTMTPLRAVQLNPFLMEILPIEEKCFPVDNSIFPHLSPSRWIPESQLREQLLPIIRSELKVHFDVKSATDIVRDSREFGFRSPTSDEWEWACAAGSRTLWRWGDNCPTDDYPSGYCDYKPHWNWHERPNAFGLTIAFDDYKADYCEDGVIRGGDGGGTTCGGAGFLAAWLLLASSSFEKNGREKEGGTRRVFPLEDVLP